MKEASMGSAQERQTMEQVAPLKLAREAEEQEKALQTAAQAAHDEEARRQALYH